MYSHDRTNRIVGWAMAAFAFIIYMMTTAPTVAFWDNGEFIAVGAILGVGHPPGSPVYTLLSRLFSLLPFPNVAQAVNFSSIVGATFAIAFLYFSLARIARRWEGRVESFWDGLPTYVTGISACILAAFSFSFWENALEAEVYATNIFVMTFTLWLVLRWTELSGVPRDRRRIYLVIYLLALGVGVHMGCLLWAPAFLVFIIMFEHNFAGTILLGLPFVFPLVMLSKGTPAGAVALAVPWLAFTAYLAMPTLHPQEKQPSRQQKKRGTKRQRSALQTWVLAAAAVWAVGSLIVVSNQVEDGAAMGTFVALLIVTAACIALFEYLVRRDVIERPEVPARVVLGIVALGVIALSVHAYLLIRARLNPPINESDPHTWKLVLDVVQRKQYEPMRFFPRRTPFANQFRIVWTYFKPQFTVWPLVLAAWGAVAHARRDRRTFTLLLIAFFMASVVLLFYLNISDHEVRSREYFWVPAYVGLAMWMGIGAGAIVQWGRRIGRSYQLILAGALIAFSFVPMIRHYHTMDRSENYIAYYYGWNMINFLEEDAILITNGDNDTFPLWYLQQVEGVRPDVDILNLSLVQINWYVEQLKERDVPMSFTYDEIDRMRPYWGRDPETGAPRLVSLRDIVVHDVIRETGWSRPIYFAVTVDDFLGYYDNLRLEGMVFRLVPETERHQIDVEKTRENVFENYRYDSLVDVDDGWRVMDEIYKPPTTQRLVSNYAAGFSRLGYVAQHEQPPDIEEAIRLYELALKFGDDYAPALNGLVSIYAARLYQPMKALPYAERVIRARPESWDAWIRYGGVNLMAAEKIEMRGNAEDAREYYRTAMDAYERALRRVPERPDIYPALLAIYQRLGEESKLERLIDLWQRYAPEDFKRSVESGMARERQSGADVPAPPGPADGSKGSSP
ncbi:MAG: DUF2723 domain-containing protein [Candidatus Eisenbacteria bacterium]|nr:DUF2723 domain-containing protein [Candidatus Eisenbacteria bacterium]